MAINGNIELFLHLMKDSQVYAKPINPYYVGLNAFNSNNYPSNGVVQINVPHFQPQGAGGQQQPQPGQQQQLGQLQSAAANQALTASSTASSHHHQAQHHHQSQMIEHQQASHHSSHAQESSGVGSGSQGGGSGSQSGGGSSNNSAPRGLVSAPLASSVNVEDDQTIQALRIKYGDILINKAIADAKNGDKDAFMKLIKVCITHIFMRITRLLHTHWCQKRSLEC